MNNKIGLVTMCRKAGKLVMGMDMVKDACNTGKACAVFAATDFSISISALAKEQALSLFAREASQRLAPKGLRRSL